MILYQRMLLIEMLHIEIIFLLSVIGSRSGYVSEAYDRLTLSSKSSGHGLDEELE